jgi:hypothetical protein
LSAPQSSFMSIFPFSPRMSLPPARILGLHPRHRSRRISRMPSPAPVTERCRSRVHPSRRYFPYVAMHATHPWRRRQHLLILASSPAQACAGTRRIPLPFTCPVCRPSQSALVPLCCNERRLSQLWCPFLVPLPLFLPCMSLPPANPGHPPPPHVQSQIAAARVPVSAGAGALVLPCAPPTHRDEANISSSLRRVLLKLVASSSSVLPLRPALVKQLSGLVAWRTRARRLGSLSSA